MYHLPEKSSRMVRGLLNGFCGSAELVTSVEAQRRFPGPPWGHACFGLILVCLSAAPESISRIDMVRTVARDIIIIDYSGR